ncbi:hypothetical protein D3C80_870900 [compost metagenome]
MARTIAQHRTSRNATEAYAQAFRAVGVSKASSNANQLDRATFRAFVQLVAVVVALAINSVQVRRSQACGGHVRHALVHRDVGTAQVNRITRTDLDIKVIATRTCLVSMVNLDRVVAAGFSREGTRNLSTATPSGGYDRSTAHGDHQTIIGSAAEGVGFAFFQIDQARGFRATASVDAAIRLYIRGRAR